MTKKAEKVGKSISTGKSGDLRMGKSKNMGKTRTGMGKLGRMRPNAR